MTSSSAPLRVGFLTSTNPLDRRSWSGVHYSIFKAAERILGPVTALGPVPMVWPLRIGDNLNRRIIKPLTGKRYQYSSSVVMGKLYAQVFKQRLAKQQFDVLLAPAAFTEISYLDTDVPIVYIEDSTLNQLIDFYPGMSGLLPLSKKELNFIEQRALDKAALVCYSSDWAARSAVEDYGTDPGKVVVIPFGSNYPNPPARTELLAPTVRQGPCRLFFLGGEWGRKGGAIAYETMVQLNQMGLPTELTVVGCQPPAGAGGFDHPGFRTIPFLNMSKPEDLAQLDELFRSADFFILPSRAECAAIAFCDANSFGVPVFTTDVGGISSFIEEGVNGFMLPLSATGQDFAHKIHQVFNDRPRFARMRELCRQKYERVLNWDAWGQELRRVLVEKGIVK